MKNCRKYLKLYIPSEYTIHLKLYMHSMYSQIYAHMICALADDLYKMLNLKYFQRNLFKKIKRINEDALLYIPADKTDDLYKFSEDNYNKLLTNKITMSYKKTTTTTVTNVNKKPKCIAQSLHLDDINGRFNQHEFFVTFKDHKEIFTTIQNADKLIMQNLRLEPLVEALLNK